VKVKRWIEDHKVPLIPVSIIVVVLGVAAWLTIRFLMLSQMQYTFYYPDMLFQKMESEPRSLKINPVTDYMEQKLVEDYFLGPLKYELRMPVEDDLKVSDIWLVRDKNSTGIVINFSEKLSTYIRDKNDQMVWLIQGLLLTLKKNTDVKQIVLLERGNKIPEGQYIGKWQPAFPILVE
jgi:hypothetical protein